MRYVLRRLGFFVLTLWAALTLNFFIPRFMPGSPLQALRDRTHNKLSPDALQQMLTSFGFKPHQNVVVQYLEYLKNMVTGHWGISIGATLGEPVSTLVSQALPWTLGLVGVATVLAFALGSLIGVVAGWKRGGKLDSMLPPVFVVTSALPFFWVGLLLILVFSVWTNGWLPSDFNYDPDLQPEFSLGFIENVLKHAVLPGVTILITSIGGWVLTMRNNMITTLAEDYVR
ncbi:MAG: peptide/nickel transport system permease protein, partial [Actinomycetota bacterium]|nr:peptide/nickel transport system permease protein [Actinomycetota bacterium]